MRTGGVALIELRVVAGILAAIPIPIFIRIQMKSKPSEAKTNGTARSTS